jgi:phosphate transport system protein
MTLHFLRDLDLLRKSVMTLGGRVESSVEKAITALLDDRQDLAEEVIRGDAEVDEQEMLLESECLKILALHQPVAQDLRFIVTVLKVNNDLERIGDLAVNISERASRLACQDRPHFPPAFREMGDRTKAMVRASLDALFEQDATRAREIVAADDAVDRLLRDMYALLKERLGQEPERVEASICMLLAARDLERIADLATNIAEDIVFLAEGKLIRHAHRYS